MRWLGNEWLSKAQAAYRRSLTACAYEHANNEIQAGQEWQTIFGSAIPLKS
jgi:hypothetical protein